MFIEFYFKFENLWSAKGLLASYTSFNYPNTVIKFMCNIISSGKKVLSNKK